jgi:hypothetical protein
MDENPYEAPQGEPSLSRTRHPWPAALYLLVVFVVVPIIVATVVLGYRVAIQGLFPEQR